MSVIIVASREGENENVARGLVLFVHYVCRYVMIEPPRTAALIESFDNKHVRSDTYSQFTQLQNGTWQQATGFAEIHKQKPRPDVSISIPIPNHPR